MIDIKKLIDSIEVNVKGLTERQIRQIADVLEMQPKNEWIPCEERLPNDCELVIGWDKCRGKCVLVKYYLKKKLWIWGNYKYVEIIAWQPLPQPYKKEGAE